MFAGDLSGNESFSVFNGNLNFNQSEIPEIPERPELSPRGLQEYGLEIDFSNHGETGADSLNDPLYDDFLNALRDQQHVMPSSSGQLMQANTSNTLDATKNNAYSDHGVSQTEELYVPPHDELVNNQPNQFDCSSNLMFDIPQDPIHQQQHDLQLHVPRYVPHQSLAGPYYPEGMYPPLLFSGPKKTKPKRVQVQYEQFQLEILQKQFAEKNSLTINERTELAIETGLTDKQVSVWFRNRRLRTIKKSEREQNSRKEWEKMMEETRQKDS